MILKSDEFMIDPELDSLRVVLQPVQEAIAGCWGSANEGSYDAAEHLLGIALIAAQKYLSASCRAEGVSKQQGLALGPNHETGEPVVRLLDRAANAWKHEDEWDWEKPDKHRDRTAGVFDLLGPDPVYDTYPYSNLLPVILGTMGLELARLEEVLVEWRDALRSSGTSATSNGDKSVEVTEELR